MIIGPATAAWSAGPVPPPLTINTLQLATYLYIVLEYLKIKNLKTE